jgi:predicted ATPase
VPALTRFVGRTGEVRTLLELSEKARSGEGNLVLVEGESGVGKTRLVREALEEMKGRGFTVLEGQCTEGSDPYLPFITAFSDTTTIEGAFLIYRDGRVIAHWSRKADFTADAEVVSSMLTAIQDFILQSFASTPGGELREVRHGGLDLIVEHAPDAYLAVVVSGPRPLGLQQQMKGVLEAFRTRYAGALVKWDGVLDRFAGVEDFLRELVSVRLFGIEQMRGVQDGTGGRPPKQYAEKDRERMFEGISWHIQSIAQGSPLALFLDDIQWMDTASLHLLHYIARTTKAAGVLVLCTCRPEDFDISSALTKVLREMDQERLLRRIQLRRLPLDDVRSMVVAQYGVPPAAVPNDFVAKLFSETEGNPFFVEEVLHSLVEEDAINPGGTGFARSLVDIPIPSRVEDIVLRRVERLSESDREVLSFAAAIGTGFDFELLRKASGLDEMELASSLERMVKAHLVSEELRFDHGMIREVLYKKIPPFKATIMHKRLGLALEELHRRDPAEACSALSYHFSKGNVPQKAIEYSVLAGERARARHAPDEAINHYKTALFFLESSDERDAPPTRSRELALLLALEELSENTADLDTGTGYGLRAAELAEAIGDCRALSHAHRGLGDLLVGSGDWERALEHYRRSLEVAQESGDAAASSAAYRSIGNVHFRTGDYARAIEHHRQSLDLAEKLPTEDSDPLRMQTYIDLANVYTEKGECGTAVDFYQRAMDIGIRTRSIRDVATALNNLGDVHLKMDECDVAAEYFEKALSTFKQTGTVMDIVVTLCNLGESCARCRDIERAQAYSDEAMRYLRRLGEVEMPFQLHQNFGMIFWHRKEYDRSAEHFEAAVSALKGANMPYYLGSAYYEMGLMFRDSGDPGKARENIQMAADIFCKVGAEQFARKAKDELARLEGAGPDAGAPHVEGGAR